MAMPRKGSRLFTLDGAIYRWRVRSNLAHGCRSDVDLTFLVELAENPGAALMVNLPNSWRNEHTREPVAAAIRPALVRACLRKALAEGWTADKPGPTFTLNVDQEALWDMVDETLTPSHPLPWERSVTERTVAS